MFCGKCGTQNVDNASFCKKCDSPLNARQRIAVKTTATPNRTPVHKKHKRTARDFKPLVLGVVALIAAILLFTLLTGRSYKATVKQYFNAQFDANAEAVIDLIPDKMLDYVLEEEGYDRDELIEEADEMIQSVIGSIERAFGDNWKVSYAIAEVEDLDGSELKELKKDYEDYDLKVSAAKTVTINIDVKTGDQSRQLPMDISLVKIGNKWYLDLESMGGLF